jgi:hypothetical protein
MTPPLKCAGCRSNRVRILKRPGVTRRRFIDGEWVETRSTGEEAILEIPGSALDGVSLKRSDLVGANLAGHSLKGADLTAAILTGCDLSNADLTGASLRKETSRGHRSFKRVSPRGRPSRRAILRSQTPGRRPGRCHAGGSGFLADSS